MKIGFKILNIGSGGKMYFEILRKLLSKKKINSSYFLLSKYFEIFPPLIKFFNKKTHSTLIHSNAEYGWAFAEKNKPLIITIHHDVLDKEFRKGLNLIKKLYHCLILKPNMIRSLNRADRIIAVSEYTKESILRNYGNFDIKVIPNFIDTDLFKPVKIIDSDSRFKLFFVGNLIKRKGADLLPKIMEMLGKDYVLYYTSGLRSKVPKNFNLPNMVPLGRLSETELIEQYNKCDAVLFPTRLEGFGYAAVEAMACAKPVITTRCSALPEVIEDWKNGFLCNINDIEDYVAKIRILKSNRNLIKKMSLFNRKKAVEKFSLNKVGGEYVKLYKEFN